MILQKIVDSTKRRIGRLKGIQFNDSFKSVPQFSERIDSKANFILEIKFQSPSEGHICPKRDIGEIAQTYLDHGAKMISVLTEPDFFGGDPEFLRILRNQFPDACLLMKDFIIDPIQIYQAKSIGASCYLLLANLLDDIQLKDFLALGKELGMEALVETHDEIELERAYKVGATIVGVNNRNLKTMEVDWHHSLKLAGQIDRSKIHISESGLRSKDQIDQLLNAGFQGFLVGTHLMKSPDLRLALKSLGLG